MFPAFPYPYEQNIGAYIGICAVARVGYTPTDLGEHFTQRLDERQIS